MKDEKNNQERDKGVGKELAGVATKMGGNTNIKSKMGSVRSRQKQTGGKGAKSAECSQAKKGNKEQRWEQNRRPRNESARSAF